MDLPIYFDYMATTPVEPLVAEKMQSCLLKTGIFGNPSSQSHRFGWEAHELVEKAKKQVADLIHADSREIVWTSGATESNNLAIKGAVEFYHRKGKHIVTMSTEHKAVLLTCKYLQSKGYDVTFLDPEPNGLLDLNKLENALRDDTLLVSIMHVNNETGVIQNVEAISKIVKEKCILFHVDAAQSAGKLTINLQQVPVDLMSFSSHKIYGPKGLGVLYVRRTPRVRLEPQIHGGSQQHGLRSGTLPTPLIVGMGQAFAIAKDRMTADHQHILSLRNRFWDGISKLDAIKINGDPDHMIPGCLNLQVGGIVAETLMLSLRDLAISAGSACTSASASPSHVLSAMGLTTEQANCSLRISFGRCTTEEEIDYAISHFVEQVTRLRDMSPLWEKAKKKALSDSDQ